MNRTTLKQYVKLAEFLGLVLGPCYEITLHDIHGKDSTIVAIVNGSISGRSLDSPPTARALRAISENAAGVDYCTNYNGLSAGNQPLRSSTFYIKDKNDDLVGMLCINFDDTQFQELTNRLFQIIHPDNYVENNITIRSDILEADDDQEPERFGDSMVSVADAVVQEVLDDWNIPVERLSQDEKVRIVAKLDQRGIFRLKGAVPHVSGVLHSSPASIYRYLARVRETQEEKAPRQA